MIHRHAAVLSAYGLYLSNVTHEVREPCSLTLEQNSLLDIQQRAFALQSRCQDHFVSQGYPLETLKFDIYLNLRYEGSDVAFMIPQPKDKSWNFEPELELIYQQQFGFKMEQRTVIVDDIRVRGTAVDEEKGVFVQEELSQTRLAQNSPHSFRSVYWGENGQFSETPVYNLKDLMVGDILIGPALVVEEHSTIVVHPECSILLTSDHLVITVGQARTLNNSVNLDPIQLSIFSHRFMSIAEQMGLTLQKIAISTNIKERLDFSCALFGPDGGLVANAPHIPVHLGSMQEAVRWQMNYYKDNLRDGDVIVSNHPIAGGSHLPDVSK